MSYDRLNSFFRLHSNKGSDLHALCFGHDCHQIHDRINFEIYAYQSIIYLNEVYK